MGRIAAVDDGSGTGTAFCGESAARTRPTQKVVERRADTSRKPVKSAPKARLASSLPLLGAGSGQAHHLRGDSRRVESQNAADRSRNGWTELNSQSANAVSGHAGPASRIAARSRNEVATCHNAGNGNRRCQIIRDGDDLSRAGASHGYGPKGNRCRRQNNR